MRYKCWASARGGTHTCFIDASDIHVFTHRIWAPHLVEAQHYTCQIWWCAPNMWWNNIWFYPGLPYIHITSPLVWHYKSGNHPHSMWNGIVTSCACHWLIEASSHDACIYPCLCYSTRQVYGVTLFWSTVPGITYFTVYVILRFRQVRISVISLSIWKLVSWDLGKLEFLW